MQLNQADKSVSAPTGGRRRWRTYSVDWRQCLRHGLRGSLIQQLTRAKQQHGDYLRIRLFGPLGFYVLTDPESIAHVMVKNQKNYIRGEPPWTHLRRGLGNGLVTSDGDIHREHRKIVMQCFTRAKIAEYGRFVEQAVAHLRQDWQSVAGRTADVHEAMVSHTLLIIGRVLFGLDLSDQVISLMRASQQVNHAATTIDLSLLGRAGFIPTRTVRRLNRAVKRLDALLYGMIHVRRAEGADGADVLSALLRCQAANQDNPNSHQRLSDKDIRDELATLFGAGHETSACMLSWTWLLLSQNPKVRQRLQAELKRVLNGRDPRVEDVPKLVYTAQVLKESMRIYPPVWINGRQAVEEDWVNGRRVAPGMMMWIPSYLVHHDARWYPQPERFLPERFQDNTPSPTDFRYFPFGGGSRLCVGGGFAMMEGILTLAGVAQHFNLGYAGNQPVQPYPLVSLTPRGGMPMRIDAVS